MDDSTNVMILVSGLILFAAGGLLTFKNILKIKRNTSITGEIYDIRSGYQEGNFPVIKYEIDGKIQDYTSYHHSILQKIGNKIQVIYSEKDKRVIGTYGEFFFKPILIMLVGLLMATVIVLYELSI